MKGRENNAVEASHAQPERSTGTTVFGLVAICWGIWFLYRCVVVIVGKPWAVFDEVPTIVVGFSTLLAGIACIVSGFGLLRLKKWSRFLTLEAIGLIGLGLLARLVSLGPATEEWSYLIHFGLVALFIWFLNRRPMRTRFPFGKWMQTSIMGGTMILLLLILGVGTMWVSVEGYKIPKLQKGVYKRKPEGFYATDYFRSPFPLKHTLAIPNGSRLIFLEERGSSGQAIGVYLAAGRRGGIHMTDGTSFSGPSATVDSEMFEPFGYGDQYSFARKLFLERYGMVFLAVRGIAMPWGSSFDCQVEEVQMDELRAFVVRENSDGEWTSSEYHLFLGKDGIGGGRIFGGKGEGSLNKQEVEAIISSIRLQEEPLKSAQEFFDEGMTLLDEGDVEKAKFSLASALLLGWENADYHYHLGRALAHTENWSQARRRFERTLTLEPDYAGAQDQLEQVKAKENKEE